ncbi:MAG: LytTR family transcriptional regulator DNA-binding domain-containing protein [Bacteroidales bacterium]|nr:LytTR family transcriptional regulator DNA-binding domain-containing protein [Bacteroidales bacterium]
MPKHIVISKGTELHRFPLDALICVSADGNYSYVLTVDGKETLICLQLGQIEALMVEQLGAGITNFVRLGRGLIINIDYINHIDISKQLLVMSDCRGIRKELSASREALIKLKELVEQSLNSNSNE